MGNSFSSSSQLQIHLEEYKSLRSEIEARLGYQHSLLNWALVFLVAIIGIIFSYPTILNTLAGMNLQWVFLFIPLIFLFIAFAYQEQYYMIADLGRYLNVKLRPKVCLLLGITEEEVFAWEDYLGELRQNTSLLEGIACNARYILLIVISTIWWLFYILATLIYLKISWGVADWILLVVDVLLIGVTIYLYFPITVRFRKIIKDSSCSPKEREGLHH